MPSQRSDAVRPATRHLLITGANGFIGKNLVTHLYQTPDVSVRSFVRGDDVRQLPELVAQADTIIHLAGENRPEDQGAFARVNTGLTLTLCDAVRQEVNARGRKVPLILASSIQAELDNPYGRSKRAAEQAIEALSEATDNPCVVFRLPGVFGKWCKPNYNSVVATFCHNIVRGLPIQVNEPDTKIRLVYVDDVVSALMTALALPAHGYVQASVQPEYSITLRELAEQIRAFNDCRTNLVSERVGSGLVRALYATYLSYMTGESFSYEVPQHSDRRGVFVEMLKTIDSGQVSYFTAHPGITRGGHYHHTKSEKFLVIRGEALFRFRHLLTNELVELRTSGTRPQVVDTIPGWSHDITNIGDDEMVVMLWANENFDPQRPDTVPSRV